MPFRNNPGLAALVASLACGPIFLILSLLEQVVLAAPQAIPVDPALGGMILVMMFASLIVGFFLGLFPNLIGAALMGVLAEALPSLRAPFAWAAAGAAGGALILWLVEPGEMPRFALIATSIACALICRRFFAWPDRPYPH